MVTTPTPSPPQTIDVYKRQPFYESMPMQPEIVLEDLIHAFHPDLLPDYKPTYYELLK